jgi:hypothetical protein
MKLKSQFSVPPQPISKPNPPTKEQKKKAKFKDKTYVGKTNARI